MFDYPFRPLAFVLFFTSITLVFLPFGILFGYPWLGVSAMYLIVKWINGNLRNAAGTCMTWFCWLGIVICLHGLLLGSDFAIAGPPASMSELQFGSRVAKLCGGLAVAAAIASFVISSMSDSRRS